MRSIFLPVLLAVIGSGCAGSGNYYKTYQATDPNWVSTFPNEDADLHETLAGLYAPNDFDYRLLVGKLSVLRVSDDAAVELSKEEIEAALGEPPGGHSYGIVAVLDCRSQIDTRMWHGQKVSWMLLHRGRLSAWDVHAWAHRCVVSNQFRPAPPQRAGLERQVTGFRDRRFPRSMGHAVEYYTKGVKYTLAGRVRAAEEMLTLGDETFDASDGRGTKFERPSEKIATAGDSETALARGELVRGIGSLRP
jgi:hypothetical protein